MGSPSVALVSEGGQTHSLFWHSWLMYSNVRKVPWVERFRYFLVGQAMEVLPVLSSTVNMAALWLYPALSDQVQFCVHLNGLHLCIIVIICGEAVLGGGRVWGEEDVLDNTGVLLPAAAAAAAT